MVLKILLSIFPFTFATFLASWSFLVLSKAIRSWKCEKMAPSDSPDAVFTTIAAILLAGAACVFGSIPYFLFQ